MQCNKCGQTVLTSDGFCRSLICSPLLKSQQHVFAHNKTGNEYTFVCNFGLKLFKKWFYFVIYKDSSFYFARTHKSFHSKFSVSVYI